MTAFLVALSFFCLPETYHPVLLKFEARRLRKETGDDRYWHPQEKERISMNNILTKYIGRPGQYVYSRHDRGSTVCQRLI